MTRQYLYLSKTEKEKKNFKFKFEDHKIGDEGDEELNTYITQIKNDKKANWFEKRLINLVE